MPQNEFPDSFTMVAEHEVYAFSTDFLKGKDWPKKNIHTDLEFAESCGLPSRAASGAMFEGYLTELMINLFGVDWLTYGKMSLKFIAIVDVNNTILPKATIQSKQVQNSDIVFTMDVWCENQHGSKVVVGTLTGTVR